MYFLIFRNYIFFLIFRWGEMPLEQAIKMHSQESALTLLYYGCSRKRKRKQPSFFHLAINEKQWSVVRFLTHLYPRYLQEKWLRDGQWPVAVYYRPEVRESLMKATRDVWTLKQYCRSRVFNLVGKNAPMKIDKLPIPELLKKYLRFNEFIKEESYTKQSLDVVECPFDCITLCPLRNCPELDISMSSDSDSDFDGF